MREVGLLEVSADHRGAPGRPQHRYALAPDAPSLGLEPPTYPLLARMLARAATRAGATAADALAAGYEQGVDEAEAETGRAARLPCTEAVVGLLARLGFDPEVAAGDGGTTTVAFARCPFQADAAARPELICSLHRGLVEGFADARGGTVVSFSTLVDRDPCRVRLADR
jgi:predicted ArsR family transcriptional regulator